jgi:hypothetical protein
MYSPYNQICGTVLALGAAANRSSLDQTPDPSGLLAPIRLSSYRIPLLSSKSFACVQYGQLSLLQTIVLFMSHFPYKKFQVRQLMIPAQKDSQNLSAKAGDL